MSKASWIVIACAAALAACTPPAHETPKADVPAVESTAVDPVVVAVAQAAVPGLTVTGGELDAEDGEYEVIGTAADGAEVELDMRQINGVWNVIEIQRDVVWARVPDNVRAAAEAAPDAFVPVRVIESVQPVDGAVIYELFDADDQPGHPSREVRLYEGEAAVMPPPH
jgi:hypothetical protein